MKTSTERRAIVVLDAGIATEENRKLIKGIGFDYVCVSPTKIKDYRIQPGKPVCQITTTTNKQTESDVYINLKVYHYSIPKVYHFNLISKFI